MSNYFNKLNFREKLIQLKKSCLLFHSDFSSSINYLKNKKIVIIGCGSQGLNQALNMRDSGLKIKFSLRKKSILQKNLSWKNAINNNFIVDTYENLIPEADLVINLTPDKQHSSVVKKIQPLMKYGSVLGYSHGFNIVEIGEKIRKDITVVMVAPKCPGTEVRKEYMRGFGVPSLIAVHPENDFKKEGIKFAKAWAASIGSHRVGVLESSFVAEVKSDLMGEQTILCGLLQSSTLVFYDKMIKDGINPEYAGKFLQNGWEVITKPLKIGGISLMMDRLKNFDKLRAHYLSNKIKKIMEPLFKKHMDDIISGKFSKKMIQDWENNDKILLSFRKKTQESNFEKCLKYDKEIPEQEYFNNGILLVSIIKAGIELSYEIMIQTGISPESAYYESLHELPLIANLIARRRLYEMNVIISDTAEFGNYLFSFSAMPILKKFLETILPGDLGKNISIDQINNIDLKKVNYEIENHPIEKIGKKLRKYMEFKKI